MNESQFASEWRLAAQEIAGIWGVPAPLRLHLQPDPVLPAGSMQITFPKITPINLRVEGPEDQAVITESEAEQLPDPAQEVMQYLRDKKLITQIEMNRRLRSPLLLLTVPRWSLPVWKTAGYMASSG
jgi:hypothetical protein